MMTVWIVPIIVWLVAVLYLLQFIRIVVARKKADEEFYLAMKKLDRRKKLYDD